MRVLSCTGMGAIEANYRIFGRNSLPGSVPAQSLLMGDEGCWSTICPLNLAAYFNHARILAISTPMSFFSAQKLTRYTTFVIMGDIFPRKTICLLS